MAGGALEHFLPKLVYASDHFGELTAAESLRRHCSGSWRSSRPAATALLFLPWLAGSMAPSRTEPGCAAASSTSAPHDPRPHGPRRARGRVAEPALGAETRWRSSPAGRFTHYSIYGGGARSDLWCADHGRRSRHAGAPARQLRLRPSASAPGCSPSSVSATSASTTSAALVRTRRVFDPIRATPATYDGAPRAVREGLQGDAGRSTARSTRARGRMLMDHDEIAAVLDVGIAAVRDAGVDRARVLPHGHDRGRQARRASPTTR